MEYLKVFETIEEQQSYLNGDIIKPNITVTRGNKSSINYVPKVPKIVNHGTIITWNGEITWEYPVASEVNITCTVNYFGDYTNLVLHTSLGSTIGNLAIGPGETFISVDSIDPQEDDMYIYEIILQ